MLLTVAALVIILIAIILMFKRVDVRLSLGLCAVLLFLIAGKWQRIFVIIAQQMTNEKTVVPICTAMGFAYVLKLTECDRHLTHLLLVPLRYTRTLLIPGGIIAAYIVNSAIISQSSTAAIVGTVLLPLLLAANIQPIIAGSLLLLGSSMGGELFNPGAVEIGKLTELTKVPATTLVAQVMPVNLTASVTVLIVFCLQAVIFFPSAKLSVEDTKTDSFASSKPFDINLIKALIPLLPLALLFIVPALVQLPKEFSNNSVSIAAAMLIAVAAAGLTTPKQTALVTTFFDGVGFAYANIISIIIVATIFTEGIKANGLILHLTNALANRPSAVEFASLILPFTLAGVTGSGSAPAIAVMNILVPVAATMNLDPVKIGALAASSAQLGRTISPVAAVVIMSATISQQPALNLVKCVAIPLLAGFLALLVAAFANWI